MQQATACHSCHQGMYQPTKGQPKCERCNRTSYQPDTGASACLLCTKNSAINGNIDIGTNITDCTCNENTYRRGSAFSTDSKCVACPPNGICKGGERAPYAEIDHWGSRDTLLDEPTFYPCDEGCCLEGHPEEGTQSGVVMARCAEGYASGVLCVPVVII